MSNITSLRGARPVAVVPASASYRIQPGRLVTFAGLVRPAAVTGFATADAPSAAKKAA
jgi:hypothetical protein